MTFKDFARVTLVGLLLGLAACGIKGDPIQPGSEEDQQKEETGY